MSEQEHGFFENDTMMPDDADLLPADADAESNESFPAAGSSPEKPLIERYLSFAAAFVRHNFSAALFSAAVFAMGAAAGYFAGAEYPFLMETLADMMGEKSAFSAGDPMRLSLLLFANNAYVSSLCLLSGLFLVGPVFISFVNGLTIGIVAEAVLPERGFLWLAAGLLPHGIFELSAVFLSAGCGLRLGLYPFSGLFSGRFSGQEWIGEMKEAAAGFLFVIIPLLIAAAFIESFVTPAVMNLVS